MSWFVGILQDHVTAKHARPLAWALVAIFVFLLLWGAKCSYDNGIREDVLVEARADAVEKLDDASGEADVASTGRKQDHQERVRTTEELLDEALEAGCAVGEYLASNGSNCVR